MITPLIVALGVVVLAIVAVAIWLISKQQRRRAELREHFGPEYERTVRVRGAEHDAERELEERRERVHQLHLRSLTSDQSIHYAAEWRSVQTQFVDDPEHAVAEADQVVVEVMQLRGYPMVDFEQRAADVSVDHPDVVEHYRAAHAVAEVAERGDATTEDLRQAMVHFRYLFDDLIDAPEHVEVTR